MKTVSRNIMKEFVGKKKLERLFDIIDPTKEFNQEAMKNTL